MKLKQEQKRERKRMKKRRRLQRKEDKRYQKMQLNELHAEFEERRIIRDEARAYRKLEREYGAEVAAEMQAKEAEERLRLLRKVDEDSEESEDESVDVSLTRTACTFSMKADCVAFWKVQLMRMGTFS